MKPIEITTRWKETRQFVFAKSQYIFGQNLAIKIYSWDNEMKYWKVYSTLTVNLPGMCLDSNEAFLDTNNGDPNIIKALEDRGWIKNTGITRKNGYCTYPLYEFTEEFLNIKWDTEVAYG